jgi:hypothetical protein
MDQICRPASCSSAESAPVKGPINLCGRRAFLISKVRAGASCRLGEIDTPRAVYGQSRSFVRVRFRNLHALAENSYRLSRACGEMNLSILSP